MQYSVKILIVEDEEWAREFLKDILIEEGHDVVGADNAAKAIEVIGEGHFDLVITDLRMEGGSGIDVLKFSKSQEFDPEVLLTTAFGSVESAVEAIKLGAFDYLTKPLESERVLVTVAQALEKRRLKSEVEQLRGQVEEMHGNRNVIAASSLMRKVLELVDLVSRTDSNVLIEGESGTGKELVAKAVHFGGSRAAKPFIAVNCGALPDALLESELFGYVKGAFTGAAKDKKGLFEAADGGSLLLDEVGDMPLPLQVKLLRVLQEGEVRRVGSNSSLSVDVRVIASTNKRLDQLVSSGQFREDLYYRLKVVPVYVPPLRERKEDIMPLLNHFRKKFNDKLSKDIQGFDPQAIDLLLGYDWPGNIRELENLVEGAMALSRTSDIPVDLVRTILRTDSAVSQSSASDRLNLSDAQDAIEKEYIVKALEKSGWNQVEACKDLGIGRTSLWRKMEKYELKRDTV